VAKKLHGEVDANGTKRRGEKKEKAFGCAFVGITMEGVFLIGPNQEKSEEVDAGEYREREL